MTGIAHTDPFRCDPDPRRMSTMLDLHCRRDRNEWRPDELKDMFLHQLRAPLHLSLGALSAEVVQQLRRAEPPLNPHLSLRELLRHPQPPIEVLKLIKRFAKLCRGEPDNPLPSEVVMFLYYASIATAIARGLETISDLSAESLRQGLCWFVRQPWVDDELRALLEEALSRVPAIIKGDGTITTSAQS